MKQQNRGKTPSLSVKEVLDIRRKDDQGQYLAPIGFYSRLHGLSYEHVRKVRRGEVYAWITEGLEGITEQDAEVSREIVQEIEAQIIGTGETKPLSPEVLESYAKLLTKAAEPERKPTPANPYLLDPTEREDSAISADINSAIHPKEPTDAKQPTDPSQQQPARPGYGDDGGVETDPSLD